MGECEGSGSRALRDAVPQADVAGCALGGALPEASGQLDYYAREREASAERANAAGRDLPGIVKAMLGWAGSPEDAQTSLRSLELDLDRGDASDPGLSDLTAQTRLMADPELRKYLEGGAAQDYASRYVKELADFARSGGIARGRPRSLQSPEFYLQSKLPEIGREFQAFRQDTALSSLKGAQADREFAPTLSNLLSNYALRSPGTKRDTLLAQNSRVIKNTYDEFLKRKGRRVPLDSLSLGQQEQTLRRGIL